MIPPVLAGLEGQFAGHGARARETVRREVPVLVAAGIRTVDVAARIVREGSADLVGMARAHLADPEVVGKARAGRLAEIRRCAGANQGCVRRAAGKTMISCTVNPAAGREMDLGPGPLDPAGVSLRVLVVGGGPAGMKAAETAALRGHQVTLLERTDQLGGQLRLAGRLPGRSTWLDVADDLAAALGRLGVEVRLGVEATAEHVRELAADRVLLATGAHFDKSGFSSMLPFRESLPGAELTLSPVEVLADLDGIGARVVILDNTGELLPLGLALLLRERGHEVEVITARLHAGTQILGTLEFPWIYPRLKQLGVRFSEQSFATAVEAGGVGVASIWGVGEPRTVPADSVVLIMERRANRALAESLAALSLDADLLGDCLAPRDVDDAIRDGFERGRLL